MKCKLLLLLLLLLSFCLCRALEHEHDPEFDETYDDEEEPPLDDEDDDSHYSAIATTPQDELEEVDEENDEEYDPPPQTVQKEKAKPATVSDDDDAAEQRGSKFQYDEDEFEGFADGVPNHFAASEPQPPPPPPKSSSGGLMSWLFPTRKLVQALRPTPVPQPPQAHYYYEYAALAFLGIYAINFIIGRRTNQALAHAWAANFMEMFMDQFSRVGVGEGETDENGLAAPILLKDSMSYFKFWASGRTNCEYCMITLELKRRHDLFSLIWGIFNPTDDVLTAEIGMNEDCVQPAIFAVVRAGAYEKKLMKDHQALARFCMQKDIPPESLGLHSSLSVLTDCPELVSRSGPTLIPDHFKKIINDNHSLFICMHVSDLLTTEDMAFQQTLLQNQQANSNTLPTTPPKLGRKAIQFQFKLPSKGNMFQLEPFMKMTLQSIEVSTKLRISGAARTVAVRKRRDYQELEARKLAKERAEAAPKKEEKKVEEKELTREQQKKRDEKERKQMMKRKLPKVKVVHG